MSTADWEFFRARGKQRGFSLVAAAPLESSQSLYGWTFWGVKQGSYPSIHQTLEHSRKTSEKYLFFAKIRIEPIRAKEEKEKEKIQKRNIFPPKIRYITLDSGWLRVVRGGSGAKAPPLAARPVPWNGQGRRLVELTKGCYSEGDSQGLPG